jgi:predicted nucleic acid-binding protein
MSVFVIDASIVVKWFVPEIYSTEACLLLEQADQYVAPDLLFAHVGCVLWKKTRRGELSEEHARTLIRDLESLAVTSIPCRDLAADAHALSLATGQTVYDSIYVALALRLGTQLITADQRLAGALRAFPMLAPHVRFIQSAPQ